MVEEPPSYLDLKINKRHYFMTACHRLPERSFHFRGKPLLCYRCLGLNGGFFLFSILQFLLIILSLLVPVHVVMIAPILMIAKDNIAITFLVILLTQLPFVLDGSIQAAIERYESNNPLRFLTGLLGGYGQFAFIFYLGRLFGSAFLH